MTSAAAGEGDGPLARARSGFGRHVAIPVQRAGYKLVIVDELGYVPLSPTGAELLFEIFSQRYERGSIIVTSNLP
jgi:DNA replication protein DnaC